MHQHLNAEMNTGGENPTRRRFYFFSVMPRHSPLIATTLLLKPYLKSSVLVNRKKKIKTQNGKNVKSELLSTLLDSIELSAKEINTLLT